MWPQIIAFIATLLLVIITRPRAPKTKPLQLQDFDIPTAEEDRSIPVIFGTTTVTGPNVVWHGDFQVHTETDDGVKMRRYYLGMHFVVCYGPIDSLLKIVVDTSDVWTTPVTTSSTIYLNKPDLFGGKKAEGGIQGNLDIMMGAEGQGPNAYLQTAQKTENQPAYLGVVSAVYNKGLVSANTSYVKPWSFKVKRILQGWKSSTSTSAWYPAKAEVLDENSLPSGDMNAVHILYECITNVSWGGMRRSPLSLDEASWQAAADACYSEGMGLSGMWLREGPVEDFIQIVLDHVGAVIYQDMATGKIKIKLIRGDYDPDLLTLLDETKIIDLPEFSRPGMGELVNQVILSYSDQESNKTVPISDQNLASIQSQGFVVSESIDRSMFSRVDIAGKALTRELRSRSVPLAKGSLICNREYWKDVFPGAVFKLQWPRRNIGSVIIRITDVDYGNIESNRLTVQFVEDVFGLAENNYIVMQPPITEEPSDPEPLDSARPYETPYWLLRAVFGAGRILLVPADAGWVSTVAARKNTYDSEYEVWSRVSPADYSEDYKPALFNQAALTTAYVDQELQYVPIDNPSIIMTSYVGVAIIGDDPNSGEMVLVVGVNTYAPSTLSVWRGLFDTTPQRHSAGTKVWMMSSIPFIEGTVYSNSQSVDVKFLPRTSTGVLSINDAIAETLVMARRQLRPYPPGNVKINGQAFPITILEPTLTITWAHRDRKHEPFEETAVVQTHGNIGPEAGTTYNTWLYDVGSGTLLDSATGLAGTSWSPVIDVVPMYLRLELESQRDGYVSWQKQIRWFGFWIDVESHLLMEDGAQLLLEDGDGLLLEGLAEGAGGPPPGVPQPLASDPYYAGVTVLLDGDGTNGSTAILDKLGNVWTVYGNAQISTASPKYGTGSILLDGNGDYISANVYGAIGTGDFIVEADIRIDSLASDGEIFCISSSGMGTSTFNLVFEYKTDGSLRGSIQDGTGGTNVDITTAAGLLTLSSYYNVAFVADGSTARLFINGVQRQTGTITGTRRNQQRYCRVGRLSTTITRYANGRVENLRVTSGAPRHTGNYTPPAAAHYSWYSAQKIASYTTSGTNDAQGIATDGTHIWYSNSTTLFKYTKAGALVTSRAVTGDAPVSKSQINGLSIKDGRLFVSAAENSSPRKSWVVEYNPTTLAYIQHWQITGDWFSEGLAWNDGYWWIVFHAHKLIARCDSNFNIINTFELTFPITGSSGGYGGTQGYDGIAWFGNYLFVNIHTIYDQEKLDVYYWDGVGFTEICRFGQPSTKAHQGISFDPSDPGIMWFAERNPSGTDSFMKASFTI